MYPISNTVKALFDAEQRQVLRITGTDKNSTAISITDENVILGGFGVDRYCCNGEKLEVGTAIAGQMTLTLDNTNGTFDSVVFEGTELYVEVGIADWTQSSPTINYIPCGYFTPDTQPRRLNHINLTCLDRMTKFDTVVEPTDLTFPATVANLVGQVCTLCGVTLAQSLSGLPNADVSIAESPSVSGDITYRNLIQWCAGLMATNAWFDWNGQLRFTWYGNITNYETTTANRFSSDYYEDDLTITGAVYTNSSGVEIVQGTDDYAIDMTGNSLAGPLIATVLPAINTAVNGYTYRPFTASVINAPYLWPMDEVTFTDKDGNQYSSVLTNVAFGVNGSTALEGKGMTYAINQRAQPKSVTKEQAQLITEAMEQVETDIDESLTQQEIFNRLTDNGAAQGMVLLNGQLYVNASYINAGYLSADRIQGGTLTLGGLNNANGVMQILDASGNVVGTIDNGGVDFTEGSVTVYATDRQSRAILSNGKVALQYWGRDGSGQETWRDATNLYTSGSGGSTLASSGSLYLNGSEYIRLRNRSGTTDLERSEIEMDDEVITLSATNGIGSSSSAVVQPSGVSLSVPGNGLNAVTAGLSANGLSVTDPTNTFDPDTGDEIVVTTRIGNGISTSGQVSATGGFVGSLYGNATNVTGTVAIANGGTGVTDEQSMHTVVFNNTRTSDWSAYPTAAGIYRTTGTLWTGMPSDANRYGVLTIFGCGGYYLHQYADADGNLYYAETGSMTAPDTRWKKIFSTNTAVKITEGGTGATTAAAARTNLGIQKGEISIASTAAGTYSDTTVTFESTFTSTPTVVVGLRSGSSSANLGSCSCSVVPTSVTTTGCTVRFFNNGSTAAGPGVNWIAIG